MDQQIHEVMLSLQHLSAVVLPEIKRVSNAILVLASNAGTTHATTLETLLLDAHRIAGAAIKGLAHVVNETDDSDVVEMRKSPLPVDIELDVLCFCSRVDLDKMQLVSKGKCVLVDSFSDRLPLHNVYRVNVRAIRPDTDESRCLVSYSTEQYYSEVATDVLDEIYLRGDDHSAVPLERNPFRRMRNAFVGAAEFGPPDEFMSGFMELLHAFITQHKGAMRVGSMRLLYSMNAQWMTYLLGVAAEDLHARSVVGIDYGVEGFIDRILSAPSIRKARRIAISAHARDENVFGAAEIVSLVNFATNCGDVRRIDVLLDADHFAACLTRWIQALMGHKSLAKLVDEVLFHSEYDAELPSVLSEPVARLPKQKWPGMTLRGEPCETEDVQEKSVFAFRNENIATEITAVLARYRHHDSFSHTSLTSNFIMNASRNSDVGDLSQKHLKSTGLRSYEPLTDFD